MVLHSWDYPYWIRTAYVINSQLKQPLKLEKKRQICVSFEKVKQTIHQKMAEVRILSALMFQHSNFIYIYKPSAMANKESRNWVKFGYHDMGKIWFSNSNILFLQSMQLAVHLSTCCYWAELEFINQTPTFP